MKKWLGIFLTLALLAQCVPTLAGVKGANIATGQHGGEDGDLPNIQNIAVLNGTIYMSTELKKLYRWDAQTNEITSLPIANAYGDRLVADGDTLYQLDEAQGTLSPLLITEDAVTLGEGIQLNWRDFANSPYYLDIRRLFFSEGKLYMLIAETYSDADWRERSLYRFDIEKGTCELLFNAIDMADVCPWRDGMLAMAVFDLGGYYSGNMNQELLPAVKVFDPESKGFLETLFTQEKRFGGLAYDAEADAFFFCAGGMLLRRDARTAEAEQINYVPLSFVDDSMWGAAVTPNFYTLFAHGEIFIRSTLPQDKPSTVLRVSGVNLNMTCPDGYAAFRKNHPEIPVLDNIAYHLGSAEDIYRDMLTDTASDIYHITWTDMLETLARKGYCYDLSESAALVAAAEAIYPHLSASFYQGGKLYAIPLSASPSSVLSYSPSLLESIGLTEADLPRTMMELIDFFVRWAEELSLDHFGMKLLRDHYEPAREILLTMIFDQQAALCAKQGIPLTFDTPEMRALMQRLDEAAPSLSRLDEAEADLSDFRTQSNYESALFSRESMLRKRFGESADYTALNLRYTNEAEWFNTISLSTLIVNPNSKNKAYAVALLEDLAANMDAITRISLCPNANEPIEDPTYLWFVEETENDIIIYKEQMDSEQDDFKKRTWERTLESSERLLAYLEQYRYKVTPEMITAYRAVAENMIPEIYAFAGSENLYTLRKRYSDGQIGADQYIAESERVLRMVYLENQ